jgi:regulatory protein
MVMPDPVGAQRPNAVEQARSWLTGQTGQPVPTETAPPADDRGSGAAGQSKPSRAQRRRHGSAAAVDATPAAAQSLDEPDADADADAETVAHTIALRKLAAQARTRHELDRALQRKNVPDEVAASVLDRLEQVGLVDDQAFAHGWVESRQRRRHLSRSALRRELQAKGIDRDQVDAALAAVDSADELTAARAFVVKKSGATRGLDPLVRNRRLAAALARRGFGSGIIATVLGELRADLGGHTHDELGDDPGA